MLRLSLAVLLAVSYTHLDVYKRQTWGPIESDDLLARDNHHWREPILNGTK